MTESYCLATNCKHCRTVHGQLKCFHTSRNGRFIMGTTQPFFCGLKKGKEDVREIPEEVLEMKSLYDCAKRKGIADQVLTQFQKDIIIKRTAGRSFADIASDYSMTRQAVYAQQKKILTILKEDPSMAD